MDQGLARGSAASVRRSLSGIVARASWALVTLAIALSVTGLAWHQTCQDARRTLERDNQAVALRAAGEFQERVDGLARALRLARGFVEASHHLDRLDWRRFVEAIELERQYPGVYGFAYVARVKAQELDTFLRETRRMGLSSYDIQVPHGAEQSEPEADLYLVRFHEPEQFNGPALGLNVAASPRNRIAYDESRDLAAVRATGPMRLFQDRDAGASVVVTVPVFGRNSAPENLEDRRESIKGWVAAPVGLREFLLTGASYAHDRFQITLSPFEDESESNVIQTSHSVWAGADDAEPINASIVIGGQPWRLAFTPRTQAAIAPSSIRELTILAIGAVISILLTAIVWSVSRTQWKAERLAESMTASLRRSAGRQEALAASAKAASRAKTEFLANMSHEIRTPMTAILGYAELLDERAYESGADEEQRQWLGSIRRSGEHLLTIINDVLDLSKIESGRLQTRRRACQVEQIVNDVLDPMLARAHQKGLTLRAELATEIPSVVMTDPARLRQIMINLVGNALKFTEEGEVVANLSCTDEQLIIEVCDTGIGIDEESLPKLFEAFEQADSSMARSHEGSGLGLAISRRLARIMGGDISASSVQGKGSVFRLTLPRETPEDTPMLSSLTRSPAPPTRSAAGPTVTVTGRVLLVEDGPDNQRLITHVLKRAGLSIELAQHGLEAVQLIEGGARFDVIVMDMQMPVMDGYTAAGRLRELGCTTPIVALTAHAMDGDREKCIDAGCSEYTTKPIDRNMLVGIIARLIKVSAGRAAA